MIRALLASFETWRATPCRQSGPASGEEALIEIKSAVLAKLVLAVGKDAGSATDRDWFLAAALAIRDRIIHRWLASERASNAKGSKRVYYLSLEFLIGRLLSDVLCNLGLGECSTPRSEISAWTSTGCGRPSPTRRSATAASDGSRPASWRAWRAWGFPPSATASAMTTDCFARSSRTAGSRNIRRSGCRSATHGSSRGRR